MNKENTTNKGKYYFAIGRRKTAKASVQLFEGAGDITVNGKKLEEFFQLEMDRKVIMQPLKKLELDKKMYFTIKAFGGGTKGIRDAAQLALARALVKFDADFKKPLKDEGYLTRDDRMVERKHTGFVKARKKPQYSKR